MRLGSALLGCLLCLVMPTVASAATFQVTHTGDSGLGSLRAAIQGVNAIEQPLDGTDRIEFGEMAEGVQTITVVEVPLPTITEPVVIAGETKPDYRGTPLIEITGLAAYLRIDAGNSTVRGLSIHSGTGSPLYMSTLGGNTIVGNHLGALPDGSPDLSGYSVASWQSPESKIGGTALADRNVIPHGLEINYSPGTQIRNNILNLPPAVGSSWASVGIYDSDGSVVDSNVVVTGDNGIYVSRSADAVVTRNTLGFDASGNPGPGFNSNALQVVNSPRARIGQPGAGNRVRGRLLIGSAYSSEYASAHRGLGASRTGDSMVVDSNTVGGSSQAGIQVGFSAAHTVVENNLVGVTDTGRAIPNQTGIQVDNQAALVRANTVAASSGYGIYVGGSGAIVLRENRVGVAPSGAALANYLDNIAVAGNAVTVGPGNLSAHSGIGAGIAVIGDSNLGVRITQNTTRDNGGLGIDLYPFSSGAPGVTANDPGDADSGPNGLQNHPVVVSAARNAGMVKIAGTLDTAPDTYRVEAFACEASGEGVRYLGTANVSPGAFDLTVPATVSEGEPVGLTAIAVDGSTSELSPCVAARTPLTTNSRTAPENPPPAPPAQLPPPRQGTTANIEPVSGDVLVKRPGTKEFVLLKTGESIPIGTVVDARKGKARLFSDAGNGKIQSAVFFDGIFRVAQRKGDPTLDAVLEGGSFKSCPSDRKRGKRSAVTSAKRKPVRKLWGDGKGKFRTRGKGSSAVVRGTKWLVEDFCDATKTTVKSGFVDVKDYRTNKTKRIRAGKSYTARYKR